MNRNDAPAALLASLGLTQSSIELIAVALSHPSYANEGSSSSRLSNQRLEFLGDSVLGLVTAEMLYEAFPDLPEGRLTEKRAALVREESLARIARDIDLGDYLLMGRGADESGDRERDSVLADAIEAIIGAVYLSTGLEASRELIHSWLRPLIVADENVSRDHKSRVQEIVARNGAGHRIEYRLVQETGPDHDKTFVVSLEIDGHEVSLGAGKSKKQAEQDAARKASMRLRGEAFPPKVERRR